MTPSSYKSTIKWLIDTIKPEEVESIASLLAVTKTRKGMVYVAGNGGSAANASHMVLHLVQCGIRAMCLSDGVPLLTAIANDFGYAWAFSMALPNGMMQSSDVAMVFSCSGDSRNILEFLSAAKVSGGQRIGLLGSNGGEALGLCSKAIVFDSRDAGAVEDAHSVVIHMLKEILDRAPKERT